jgi:hypothetical protein
MQVGVYAVLRIDGILLTQWNSGARTMASTEATFYASSNGDRWQLITDTETGHHVVRHEPNLSSGGKASEVEVPAFLSRSGDSPQALALQKLLDEKGMDDTEDE